MARLVRLGVGGWPHLVVQPVQAGQALWRDSLDAQALHAALVDAARQHGVAVHAYSLGGAQGTNDESLTLVLTPQRDEALGLFMQAIGRRYVAGYNRRHGRQGSLWAGRFRSTVLEPARYLLQAIQWVEQGHWPLMAERPQRTCSLGHHLGHGGDPLVTPAAVFWALGNTPFDREGAWRQRLEQGLSTAQSAQLAEAVHKGWALASPDALSALERLTGRRLQPRPRGRPPKSPDGTTAVPVPAVDGDAP